MMRMFIDINCRASFPGKIEIQEYSAIRTLRLFHWLRHFYFKKCKIAFKKIFISQLKRNITMKRFCINNTQKLYSSSFIAYISFYFDIKRVTIYVKWRYCHSLLLKVTYSCEKQQNLHCQLVLIFIHTALID